MFTINGTYEDCLDFLRKNHIRLFDYQKQILKGFFDGKRVATARGIGRTFVLEWLGKYIAYSLNDNFPENPDIVFPCTVAIDSNYKNFVLREKECLSEAQFNKEFLCKY